MTQPEALDLGVWRLAARCCELKKAGWNIETERLPGGFTRYSMDLAKPRIDDGEQIALPLDGGANDGNS